MDNPRPEKVEVVEEVKERLEGSAASVVTEYRGLTVGEMAELRRTLRAAGGDFKVFKNTLVRRAVAGSPNEALSEHLVGPTGIAFVQGDVSAVAKALRDFAKANPALVIKGGVFEGSALSPKDLSALADLPSRDVLLARLAGLLASPMQSMAGLLKAVPQSFAYGLQALIDSKPAEAAAPAAEEAGTEAEAPAEDAPAEDAPVEDAPVEDAAPAAEEASTEAEAPAEDAPAEDAAPADEAPADAAAETETPAEDAPAEAATDDA